MGFYGGPTMASAKRGSDIPIEAMTIRIAEKPKNRERPVRDQAPVVLTEGRLSPVDAQSFRRTRRFALYKTKTGRSDL